MSETNSRTGGVIRARRPRGGRPLSERPVQVWGYLTPPLYEWARQRAQAEGKTLAALVTEALEAMQRRIVEEEETREGAKPSTET